MYSKVTQEATVEPVSLTEVKNHLRVDNTDDDTLIAGLIKAAREWCETYERRAYCVKTVQAKLDGFGNVQLPLPPLVQVDSVKYIDTAGDTQTLSSTYYDVDTHSEPGILYLAYNQTWPSPRPVHHNVEINYKAGFMTQFTAATSDTITVSDAVFSNGDTVRVITDQGDLPDPLAESTTYYVGDVSGSTLKLYTDSDLNNVVDITDAGTGTHLIGARVIPDRVRAAIKLIVGHLYEHREEVSEITLNEVPFAAKHLLCDRNYTV